MASGIIYTRVSSDPQVRGVSLDEQERASREWCARSGIEVVRVFREEGESGRNVRRTQLQQALAYLRQHRGKVEAFVVYDLSRFTRNLFDQLTLQQRLQQLDVRLLSVTLPLSLEDPHGRAVAGYLGVTNQYVVELQGEKIRACMQETLRRGRWPWPAPLGYRNARDEHGAKVVVPDPKTAPLVRLAFELAAAGESASRALTRLAGLGLQTRFGHELRPQELRTILRNAFYVGRVRSIAWGIDAPGQHEPLIDEALWWRVQRRMRPSGEPVPRTREHPDFPLRGFVRCEACGKPLTAAWSRGKSGRRYGYYFCWWRTCRSLRVAGPRLDEEFGEVLQRMQLALPAVHLVEEALVELCSAQEREAATLRELARKRVDELQTRRERLLDAYLDERVIDRETYERRLRRLDGEIADAHFEHQEPEVKAADLERILPAVRPLLSDTYRLWDSQALDGKRRLQALIFPAGATYGVGGLRTPETAWIFRHLRPLNGGKEEMVQPGGVEPPTYRSVVCRSIQLSYGCTVLRRADPEF